MRDKLPFSNANGSTLPQGCTSKPLLAVCLAVKHNRLRCSRPRSIFQMLRHQVPSQGPLSLHQQQGQKVGGFGLGLGHGAGNAHTLHSGNG